MIRSPDPRGAGSAPRGREMAEGTTLRLGGYVIRMGEQSIWQVESPGPRFEDARQSFCWLDDLAAYGDPAAHQRAGDWTRGWIDRFGRGQGPGWQPDLTADRIMRLLDHWRWLGSGLVPVPPETMTATLVRQARFLSVSWSGMTDSPARLRALAALIESGLLLPDLRAGQGAAVAGFDAGLSEALEACLAARDPEQVLDLLTVLVRTKDTLEQAGHSVSDPHVQAMGNAAHTLRSLRHADGGLPRFQGGGAGDPGALDAALAGSAARATVPDPVAMGYVRLARGRTTVIADAAPPPLAAAPTTAHASTLAFELTSGRRPLIVNCGSGQPFGPDWTQAARATPSHSTLIIDGQSSARLSRKRQGWMAQGPGTVSLEMEPDMADASAVMGHDGYGPTHGLIHARSLQLSLDGRQLSGQDVLTAATDEDRHRFERALNKTRATRHGVTPGLPFTIRFHLHPEVQAVLAPDGKSVTLTLPNGEKWEFRDGSASTIRLDPGVYLEKTAREPRATLQIVLSHRATGFETSVSWSLGKAKGTPDFVRDLTRDTPFWTDDPREDPL